MKEGRTDKKKKRVKKGSLKTKKAAKLSQAEPISSSISSGPGISTSENLNLAKSCPLPD